MAAAKGKIAGWKAPGPDMIEGVWWKTFHAPTNLLRELMWAAADGAGCIPEWLVRGRTVMIPKSGCTGEPDQYR